MSEAPEYLGVSPTIAPNAFGNHREKSSMPKKLSLYDALIVRIFNNHFKQGVDFFEFDRLEIETVAAELNLRLPENLGDLIDSFRYRKSLPAEIAATASGKRAWIILPAGHVKYRFELAKLTQIVPRCDLIATKIPDATPQIIAAYALTDEQALLARVRYNRLIDIFLGVTTYSLQNHLPTTVKRMGQIEIDEIYVGVNKKGRQFVIPVQAKGGADKLAVIQTSQDLAYCAEKFPSFTARAISTQFMKEDVIAIFELTMENDEVKVVEERHYRLVPAGSITADDLRNYANRSLVALSSKARYGPRFEGGPLQNYGRSPVKWESVHGDSDGEADVGGGSERLS